jgi:hypothetical protein
MRDVCVWVEGGRGAIIQFEEKEKRRSKKPSINED